MGNDSTQSRQNSNMNANYDQYRHMGYQNHTNTNMNSINNNDQSFVGLAAGSSSGSYDSYRQVSGLNVQPFLMTVQRLETLYQQKPNGMTLLILYIVIIVIIYLCIIIISMVKTINIIEVVMRKDTF